MDQLGDHPLSQIPIERVQERLDAFDRLDPSLISIDEMKACLSQAMDGYSCMTHFLQAPLAWRARPSAKDRPFTNIRDIWYPPSDQVTKLGRLNRPGQSVMYLADSEGTALFEMKPQVGDVFTILQVRLKNPNALPHLMELGVVERMSQFGLNPHVHLLEHTRNGKEFLQGNEEKNLLVRAFLARELTRDVPTGQEHLYARSVAIAEMLMGSSEIDGVEYPSMAKPVGELRGAANMALRAEAADRLYIADSCWMIEVLERANTPTGDYKVRRLQTSKRIDENGTIQW